MTADNVPEKKKDILQKIKSRLLGSKEAPLKEEEETKEEEISPEDAEGKTVGELAAVGEEVEETGEEAPEREKVPTTEELLMRIEKLDGKLDIIDRFRVNTEEKVMALSEGIGELRQMILDRDKSSTEIESNFERVKDLVDEISPIEIKRNLEKAEGELSIRDMRIEKNEKLLTSLNDEVKKFRELMEKVKGFENLVDILKKLDQKSSELEADKRYTERIATKVEHMFSEMTDAVSKLKKEEKKIDEINDLTNELVNSLDDVKLKQEKSLVKDDLDKLKEDVLKETRDKMPAKIKENLDSLNNSVTEIATELEKFNFRYKGMSDLIKEKENLQIMMSNIEVDFKHKHVSESAYKEALENGKKRLEEIDFFLETLNKEKLYDEIRNLQFALTDISKKIEILPSPEELIKVKNELIELQSRVDITAIRREISLLKEARKIIFGKISKVEEDTLPLNLLRKNLPSINKNLMDLKKRIGAAENKIKVTSLNLSKMENDFESQFSKNLNFMRKQAKKAEIKVKPIKDVSGLKRSVTNLGEDLKKLKKGIYGQ